MKLFFNIFNKVDTDDLNASDVQDFIREQNLKRLSIPTILRRISTVKNFYLFLEKEHIISYSLEKIEKPKGSKKLPICISIEEVEALLNAPNIDKPEGERDRAMLEVMYSSGLRVSELLSLKLKQINFERGII